MKKIVAIIVEGQTDETVLTAGLDNLLEDNSYQIQIFRGNLLTSDLRAEKSSKSLIGDYVKKELFAKRSLNSEDLACVIQIVDIDDVFISNDLGAHKELHKKRLKELSQTQSIMNISYSMYYMSTHLEDVIANKKVCGAAEKEEISFEFAMKYEEDYEGFKDFFFNTSKDKFIDYKSSWDYIKDSENPCDGVTNLYYFLEEVESIKKEYAL